MTPRRYAALRAISAIGKKIPPDERPRFGQRGRHLSPLQRPVADAVRPVRLGAQLLVPERLVFGIVPVEPADLGVALEGEHVRGDAVEEPTVVADDDSA